MNQRLQALLAEVFRMRPADVQPGLAKEDVPNWDSLKQMDLVISLENEFGITLGIPDIVRMKSVAAIIDVLREKGALIAD